jgi:hypothetical protein
VIAIPAAETIDTMARGALELSIWRIHRKHGRTEEDLNRQDAKSAKTGGRKVGGEIRKAEGF